MKNSLAFCLFIFFSITTNAQAYEFSCNETNLLFPKQTLSTEQDLTVISDHNEITKGDTYLLTGNVSLNSSDYYLAADEIKIKKSSKTSIAKGNVKYQDDEIMLIGNDAIIKKQNNNNHLSLQQVTFHYPNSKMNGKANQITDDGTQQVFESVSYSLCPLGNTDWQMKADKITLNPNTNKGVANNVVVEFLGVPVFYSPTHEWVLEGRGSGFLAPSFATHENNDYQIKIPYYFNLAPDRDLLLTLNQLSNRGSIVEAKYRQLITGNEYLDSGRFEIEGHYLDKDDITKNKRWLLNSTVDLSLNKKTNLNVAVNRVSDSNYFKEIAHTNTSASALYSHLDLTFKDTEKDLNMAIFSESEQLINNGDEKYTRAPEVSISKGFKGLGNRQMDLSLVSSKFRHKDNSKTTGVRTHAQANFTRPIINNAYSIKPNLTVSKTDYALDNATNQDRSIYSFGIDSKLFLERETNLLGTDLIQTLTPRLAYNFTPKKDQNALPNFDSADKNDSYEGLFSGKKYTGIDNIANANDITLGLESDFIDEQTGETYVSLKSAQTFYGDSIVTNNSSRRYSDIALSADFALNNFKFNNSLQYDPQTNKVDKRDSSMSYILNPRQFLTLAHHYDGDKKSAEIYGAYPLTKNIHVFAGVNRSITDSITNKETTGIAYESCCWALRLAHFKKHLGANDYDYVTNFELVLKGLASTSPGLTARLEEDVPNYLANLNDL